MKVTSEERPISNQYPRLMKSNKGSIVLFTRSKVGSVIKESDNSGFSLGEHSNDWLMSEFTQFYGSVTLSE